MDENTRRKIYAALAAPFPEEAIERTDAKVTGKGYSTTGIKYQYVVDRLCQVLGFGSFRVHRSVTVKEISRANGRPAYEALCDMTLELGEWVDGKFIVFAESVADGGHVSGSEADARKGATSSAFKKAAAFHGVGAQAYRGTLDDDHVPGDHDPVTPPMMSVVRAPNAAPVHAPAVTQQVQAQQIPPGYIRTGVPVETRPAQPERNRLSSKQLAAIWSIARKLGVEQAGFRAQMKARFGVQLEFLSRSQASELITNLNAQLNGNGSGNHADEQGASGAVS